MCYLIFFAVLGRTAPPPPAPIGFHFSAAVFNHSMVLQRNSPAALWGGGAGSNAKVSVVVSVDGKNTVGTGTGTSDATGAWSLVLDTPYIAAFPSTTVVASTDGGLTATLQDVAFGDVLLCVSCCRIMPKIKVVQWCCQATLAFNLPALQLQ